MSTTTNGQDQESVTVPLNLGLLQSLLSLQFVQLSQQGNGGSNNGANPASMLAKGQAQGNQFKPQGIQQKPQDQGAKKPIQQGANLQDAKKDQNKQNSTGNAQNQLALLSQLMQLSQTGGLGNLLQQAAGGQTTQNQNHNQNSKGSNLNMNETSNGSMSRGKILGYIEKLIVY